METMWGYISHPDYNWKIRLTVVRTNETLNRGIRPLLLAVSLRAFKRVLKDTN
ncbi:hypothetical protein AmPhEK80_0107 [Klebsiella phage AmPh_EK80]|uniref:Uncharacterized protein n=1 Tax=Klebsiella phage AmPh_EK80 TaxID=2653643 RepID=A0A5P8PKU4_9CAUD|nr:hypothetical protein AmPhEK80_0107 [Klebsiella phage AmPh_EK80]